MPPSSTEPSTQPFGTLGADPASERDDALVGAAVRAVEATGAHAGSVFLVSPDRRSLVLSAVCGTPPSLLGGWQRIPVSSDIPVAVAYRTGRTVHLAGADETMRRFPQLAMALPYAFGSASVQVKAGDVAFGAMAVVWAAGPGEGEGLSKAQRRRLRATADRLGASLAELDARGALAWSDARTVPVSVPARSAPAVRVGLFDWDLDTGALVADDALCAIFGIAPGEFDGRAATLAARIDDADLPGFRSATRTAAAEGHDLALALHIRGGGHRAVELWGRVPQAPDDGRTRPHLVGAVLDSGTGMAAVEAIERLADGFFALAPDGRVTYANHGLERLLRVRRDDLLGRRPWDVLPWLADPAYEDRYRAAMISQQPVSFLARRPPDPWLVFSLHPGAQGMTGWVARVRGPVPADAGPGAPVADDVAAGPSPPPGAPRLGTLYRVLQLGSALTEAVTAHEVCEVVAEQLLPAVGGQRLALYVVTEGRLHLLSQRGYHQDVLDVLDRFEGAPLRAGLPVSDALLSGAPLFIESRQAFARAYPGFPLSDSGSWAYLPLIASNRPVGACVLAFDEAHRFRGDERDLLTALGGLIAHALERARLYDAEFAVAHGLQDALLPHRLPALPDVRVAGRYLPGTRGMDIGGDWYDVIPTRDGVALVVGDVEGHNVAAAAVMGQLRSAVRAFATAGHRPGDVIASTNRLLLDLDPGLLASCCYVRLTPESGIARVVLAGHCPPLLRRADGDTTVLDLPRGPLLGVADTAAYPESDVHFPPGAILALYTDGLVERRGADIATGIDRLRAALAHVHAASLEELADRLLLEARHSPKRMDDIALLLSQSAPAHPRQAAARQGRA
ncbi:SpoIIE family protein phosphatase [Streptomyces gilvosporeus]|uniref:protein-serine/threonine phosphatase n=1 Tax=Streptomyces gilvosporeus TaxID=553510 RepID=A0A1V0TN10_9ACTN|nr:SpoIIE family protein phosphatase [Streptomyces gilvosporeus]ARF54321.1 phosphatase [Streptomyces gilvosporeus]